ncbi:hypothetical protein ACB092_11G135600 [Castanea dentata]
MASRAVLIQASSSSIPAYVMQSNLLPEKVLEGIDRVNRNFLWGSTENSKKMHWVGWKKVTRPKEDGGLGLQTTKGRNTALLAKLNWRFHTESNGPWAKVLKLKYCNQQRRNARNENKLPSSRTWKSLKNGEVIFKKGAKWTPGYESNLDFWNDIWSNFGPLRNVIQGPLTSSSSKLKVKDVRDSGSWNWPIIQMDLPIEIIRELQATPIPITTKIEDRLAWKFSSQGEFDLKSAYLLTLEPTVEVPFKEKWVWNLKTLPRIQAFVWRCMHQSIGVK